VTSPFRYYIPYTLAQSFPPGFPRHGRRILPARRLLEVPSPTPRTLFIRSLTDRFFFLLLRAPGHAPPRCRTCTVFVTLSSLSAPPRCPFFFAVRTLSHLFSGPTRIGPYLFHSVDIVLNSFASGPRVPPGLLGMGTCLELLLEPALRFVHLFLLNHTPSSSPGEETRLRRPIGSALLFDHSPL